MLLGMDVVWLEADCSRYEFFPDVVQQTHPDIAVINLDDDPEKGLQLVERVREEAPACAVLVASSSTDGQLILRSMRAGAAEYLTVPLGSEDIQAALKRIRQQRFGEGDSARGDSHVIAIAGATGGVGTTSVAVNMACMLAQQPENSVVLVDLDLALGDADVFLDAIPEHTLADVTQSVGRLDFTLLKRSLTKHKTGLFLLPRPVQLQDTELITHESIQKVIGLLKASFSHLIIDLSKSYTSVDRAALEAADDVLLVTQLDLPCLRNVVRLLLSFEEYDEVRQKTRIVVNRAGLDSGQISLKKAKETIGQEIFAQLPNDYRTMVEVRNNGIPLPIQAPKAAITKSLGEMIARLVGEGGDSEKQEQERPAATGGNSWLSFWPAGSKK